MAYFNRTYRVEQDGTRIDGVFVLAFIHNGRYHLTPIRNYQDGMIDCWGLVDFEGFKEKVRSGLGGDAAARGQRGRAAPHAQLTRS